MEVATDQQSITYAIDSLEPLHRCLETLKGQLRPDQSDKTVL